ncbi:MAG TPA: HipA family kinase [Thermomicrobiales bacterium]|nr:HipA family kinase [Thermomicrobiales bacterium]
MTIRSSPAQTLRTVTATRYVTPLREGGSLPAIIEADDDGMYVLKFRGAGQGPKALIAELVAGELARSLGLPVPDIVLVELDPALGRAEPDPEIQDLLQASIGLNLALDYLPGALAYSPATTSPLDPLLASKIVWFDAYVTNVDRTPRNPNLLVWHDRLYLIDHGAALYVHHTWAPELARGDTPFTMIRDHVLLPQASAIPEAAEACLSLLTTDLIDAVVGLIPDSWLETDRDTSTLAERRAAYRNYLHRRRDAAPIFTEEAVRAHARIV